MRIIGKGLIELDKGEPVPVCCQCGWIYRVLMGSEQSKCPCCTKVNKHFECDTFGIMEGNG